MKLIKKLLGELHKPIEKLNVIHAKYSNNVANWNTERKLDNIAIMQLEKDLLDIDSSGAYVSAGVYCYLDYRSGKRDGVKHGIEASTRLAKQEIAKVKRQQDAKQNTMSETEQQQPPTVFNKWFWALLALALLVILLSIFAYSHWGKKDDGNKDIGTISTSQPAPQAQSCVVEMKALDKNTANDNQYENGWSEGNNAKVTSEPTEEAKMAMLALLEKDKPHIGALKNFALSTIPNAWLQPGAVIPPLDLAAAKKDTRLIDLYQLRVDIMSLIASKQLNEITDVSYNYVDDQGKPQHHSACATDQTIQLTEDIRKIIEISYHQTTYIKDPLKWVNTGRRDGGDMIVPYTSPGNLGDTKAIVTTMPDGIKFATLIHCGQQIKPADNDKPSNEKSDKNVCKRNCGHKKVVCKKNCTNLEEKKPGQGSAPRGNAPVGGGNNQIPGPGTFTSTPSSPPASVRVNAPAPAPANTTPDPRPAPAPEKSAPTPAKPATGTVKAPGM